MKKRWLVGMAILVLVAIASLFLWPAPTPFASGNRVYLDWGTAWLPTEIKSFLSGEFQTTVAGRPLIFVLNESEADYILAVRTLIVKSEAEFVTSGTNTLHLVFSATERRTNRQYTLDLYVKTANWTVVNGSWRVRRFWEFWR